MKEMTTAEFAKANLAALDEPISVRRYTKTVGVYYPTGVAPEPLSEGLQLVIPTSELTAASEVIRGLEEEVAQLKRRLAAKAIPGHEVDTAHRKSGDPFAGLAKQDQEFFERKLGSGKKKS